MRVKGTCIVEGCEDKIHSKGYCRRHYGQMWRYGRIRVEKEGKPNRTLTAAEQMIVNCERQIRQAEKIYNRVVGVPARLHWRAKLKDLHEQRKGLQEQKDAI